MRSILNAPGFAGLLSWVPLYYLRDLRGKAAKIKEKRDVTRAR